MSSFHGGHAPLGEMPCVGVGHLHVEMWQFTCHAWGGRQDSVPRWCRRPSLWFAATVYIVCNTTHGEALVLVTMTVDSQDFHINIHHQISNLKNLWFRKIFLHRWTSWRSAGAGLHCPRSEVVSPRPRARSPAVLPSPYRCIEAGTLSEGWGTQNGSGALLISQFCGYCLRELRGLLQSNETPEPPTAKQPNWVCTGTKGKWGRAGDVSSSDQPDVGRASTRACGAARQTHSSR